MFPIQIGLCVGGEAGSIGRPSGARFTVTADGDGTGEISGLWRATSDITLTLVGNARFQTGDGEATTLLLPANTQVDVAIKCTSGTSTLKIPYPLLINQLSSTYSSVNSPILEGSLTPYKNIFELAIFTRGVITGNMTGKNTCVEMYVVGNNINLTGDVSENTVMEFLEIRGDTAPDISTITGDIGNKPNMYNYWMTSPYNTNYGSMTNLSANLTHFYNVSPLASFSGSINALVGLVNFSLTGLLHTITGNITNCPALIRFDLYSNQMTTYTAGKVYNFTAGYNWVINPNSGYGFTTAQINSILDDMANSPDVVTPSITVELLGGSQPRSIASDTDYNALVDLGYTMNVKHYPYLLDIVVSNSAPTKVVLTFDQELDESSVPATGDFTLSGKTITAVDVVGETVELTVSVAFAYGQTSNITYTLGTNKIQDAVYLLSCNSISSTAVTNNVSPILGPELVGATWYNAAYWDLGFPSGVTTVGGNAINFGIIAAAMNLRKSGAGAIFQTGLMYLVRLSYAWNSGSTQRFKMPYDGSATFNYGPTSSQTNLEYAYTSTSSQTWLTSEFGDCDFTITALSIKEIIG